MKLDAVQESEMMFRIKEILEDVLNPTDLKVLRLMDIVNEVCDLGYQAREETR